MEQTMEQLYKLQGIVEEQSKHSAEFRNDVKDTLSDINNSIKAIATKVDAISIQTTATNGRVTSLEGSRRNYGAAFKIIFSAILTIIGYCIANAVSKK